MKTLTKKKLKKEEKEKEKNTYVHLLEIKTFTQLPFRKLDSQGPRNFSSIGEKKVFLQKRYTKIHIRMIVTVIFVM